MQRITPQHVQRAVIALLWALASVAVALLLFIVIYVLVRGFPVFSFRFLFGFPEGIGESGGILPFIVATVYLTFLAILIGSPLGIGTAIFLTEYTRETWLNKSIRFGADCLAGIPSIIYGLFGFIFFVMYLGMGFSILSGALAMALMVLPTIIRTSEEAIRAVPPQYRDVTYGLGATRWQMVSRVILPSAMPGIVTGIVLSVGRTISETAVVMLTAGSALSVPVSPFDPGCTLSLRIYILALEGISEQMAYGIAAVLVISILAINTIAYWLMHRVMRRFR